MNTHKIIAALIGIVIMDRRCEMKAIAAPKVVSPPYAAGKTTVLSPSGIAAAHRVTLTMSSGTPQSFITVKITAGKAISRIKEA